MCNSTKINKTRVKILRISYQAELTHSPAQLAEQNQIVSTLVSLASTCDSCKN